MLMRRFVSSFTNVEVIFMGWSFFRSKAFGPLRVNLSSGGIGLSFGIRGARVSVGPRGTYVNLGHAGIRYRKKLDNPRPRRAALSATDTVEIKSVSELQDGTLGELEQTLRSALSADQLFPVGCIVGLAAVAWIASQFSMVAGALLGILLVFPLWALHRWDSERRTARIIYDIDDHEIVTRYALASAVGEALCGPRRLWHIHRAVATDDRKRNAGASTLISRTHVEAAQSGLPPIEANIAIWSVPAGPQQLAFLPDALVLREKHNIAVLPYDTVFAEASTTRFVEADWVPEDAEVVDTTWAFVDKDGSPDRRFNNNRQVPIVRYGELSLTTAHGINIVFQTSSVAAAELAAKALKTLRDVACPAPGKPVQTIKIDTPANNEPGSENDQLTLVVAAGKILKYVALADRRFKGEEKHFIRNAMRSLCPDEGMCERAWLLVEGLSVDRATCASYCASFRQHLTTEARQSIYHAAATLTVEDGKRTSKEVERLAELEEWLGISSR